MAFILCSTVLMLINLISAINDTNIVPTYSIAIESSKPFYSTTSIPITSDYDTLYEIYIHYQYTAPTEPDISTTFLGNVFITSTVSTFKNFNINTFDTRYCVVSNEYYDTTDSCSYYQYQQHDGEYIAYGTFLGKPSNANDYNINDIIKQSAFRSFLGDSVTNLVGYGSFIINSVDISVIDVVAVDDDTENEAIFLLLDVIDIILYAQLYSFLALCCLIIIISKLNGTYSKHDDIRYIYFIYFVVFSLNFFSNSIIFVLRIFEQQYIIFGTFSALFLVIIRLIFDILTTIKSKDIWTNPAFITKRIKEWYNDNNNIFMALSLISGPIGSISFANSRLFVKDIFFMGIPKSMILHFIGNMFWKILLLQRMPEFLIQIVFVSINGYDHYFLFALITTILCILVLLPHRLRIETIELNHQYFIQNTAFLMEISSSEINKNSSTFLLQPNALKKTIAGILEVDINMIELPSFEAIKISTESNCQNKRVYRCYGLKIHIAVNTITMSRRVILMKLEDAQNDDRFIKKLMKAWKLEEIPSIDDIVMIYDVSGDVVIQRAIEELIVSQEKEMNLQLMEDTLLREKAELYIQQKQEEEEQMSLRNSNYSMDLRNNNYSMDLRNRNYSMDLRNHNYSMDLRNNNYSMEISLNDTERIHHNKKKIKRRTPSKIHISDTSCTLDMQQWRNEGDGDEEFEDLTLKLQRITSESSVKSFVSL